MLLELLAYICLGCHVAMPCFFVSFLLVAPRNSVEVCSLSYIISQCICLCMKYCHFRNVICQNLVKWRKQDSRGIFEKLPEGCFYYSSMLAREWSFCQSHQGLLVYCMNILLFTAQDYNILLIWYVIRYILGGPKKKRPELSHGVMQQSRWNESAEKHVCNKQTSSNMSMNFHLKRFHISCDTSEIVLNVVKQCLQAFFHQRNRFSKK